MLIPLWECPRWKLGHRGKAAPLQLIYLYIKEKKQGEVGGGIRQRAQKERRYVVSINYSYIGEPHVQAQMLRC